LAIGVTELGIGNVQLSLSEAGTAGVARSLQDSQPRRARISLSVSRRSVLARRCLRETCDAGMYDIRFESTRLASAPTKNHAPDFTRGLDGFAAPAAQQPEHGIRVGIELLDGDTFKAWDSRNNEPLCLAVSRPCEEIDAKVKAFERPTEGDRPCLWHELFRRRRCGLTYSLGGIFYDALAAIVATELAAT